jgi:hypothetical protein
MSILERIQSGQLDLASVLEIKTEEETLLNIEENKFKDNTVSINNVYHETISSTTASNTLNYDPITSTTSSMHSFLTTTLISPTDRSIEESQKETYVFLLVSLVALLLLIIIILLSICIHQVLHIESII